MNFKFGVILVISAYMYNGYRCEDLETCKNMCDDYYLPVCGNDGITYSTKCNLDCLRLRNATLEMKYKGQCAWPEETPCDCTVGWGPVCASNGRTFLNICLLNCANKINPNVRFENEGTCAGQDVVDWHNIYDESTDSDESSFKSY